MAPDEGALDIKPSAIFIARYSSPSRVLIESKAWTYDTGRELSDLAIACDEPRTEPDLRQIGVQAGAHLLARDFKRTAIFKLGCEAAGGKDEFRRGCDEGANARDDSAVVIEPALPAALELGSVSSVCIEELRQPKGAAFRMSARWG
jgi:hypothetical protein